jgi:hypothetical protein
VLDSIKPVRHERARRNQLPLSVFKAYLQPLLGQQLRDSRHSGTGFDEVTWGCSQIPHRIRRWNQLIRIAIYD